MDLVPEVGTRYFKSTDGTFAVTLLKKYRRYFIRYIFEKVPTAPVLGTVIRYFLKEKFCTFWKQYFRWFYALNNDWVSYLPIVVTGTGIACSANKSTEKTSSKNQIFIIPAVLRPNVLRVCLALRHDIALRQHSSFRRKVATVASYWQICVRFDQSRIWTPDLPHQSWEHVTT